NPLRFTKPNLKNRQFGRNNNFNFGRFGQNKNNGRQVPGVAPNLIKAATANDLQTFLGGLGGLTAEAITPSGNPARPFQVAGDTFVNFAAAAARTCDRQFNRCANAANGGNRNININGCNIQKQQCDSVQRAATVQSFGQNG